MISPKNISERLYRESVIKIIKAIVITLTVMAAIVFIVDPNQHFRKASFYTPMYEYHRYLNPGIAKNFDYDSVIIGSSITENFVRSHIYNTLGYDTVNLSMPGTSLGEQKAILDVALKSGKTKNVLYCMDIFLFSAEKEYYGEENFPQYLYDDNMLNDYKYLLNVDSLTKVFYVAAGNTYGYRKKKFDRDTAFNWGRPEEFSRANALKKFREYYDVIILEHKKDIEGYVQHKKNFDYYITQKIKDNPDVNFILFYPPYSYLMWALPYGYDIEGLVSFKRHVFESTEHLENVSIFDLQADTDIVNNLDNYRDSLHFTPAINRYIIESIANRKYLLTRDNIDAYLDDFKSLLDSIDIDELLRQTN